VIEKLLRVKISHQTVSLVPPPGENVDSEGEDVTHDEAKELRFYSLSDGWRVVVTAKSPEDVAAAVISARRAEASLQELRMEQHERALQMLKAEEERLMGA